METFTKQQFFIWYAPQFNFEKNADQLIEMALAKKFIVKVGDDQYQYASEEV